MKKMNKEHYICHYVSRFVFQMKNNITAESIGTNNFPKRFTNWNQSNEENNLI